MREIKFRAWDGEKMIPFDSVKHFVEFDGTVWLNNGGREFDILNEQPHLKLMQFTGLKDKNGVEIYEGDVLRYSSDGYQFENGDVIFSDGGFKCRCTFFHSLSSTITPLFEVIGNIYVNHELLKP